MNVEELEARIDDLLQEYEKENDEKVTAISMLYTFGDYSQVVVSTESVERKT